MDKNKSFTFFLTFLFSHPIICGKYFSSLRASPSIVLSGQKAKLTLFFFDLNIFSIFRVVPIFTVERSITIVFFFIKLKISFEILKIVLNELFLFLSIGVPIIIIK